MIILNLGCGTKTSSDPQVINIDWSIYFRIRGSPLARRLAPLLLDPQRLDRFYKLPSNIIAHDLSRGIPFADSSIDVVYHSHLLEHLDRQAASAFLTEVKRVLRPH